MKPCFGQQDRSLDWWYSAFCGRSTGVFELRYAPLTALSRACLCVLFFLMCFMTTVLVQSMGS
jgi:hypothetical protein